MTIEERAERERERAQRERVESIESGGGFSLENLELGRLRAQGGAFNLALLGALIAFVGCFGSWTSSGFTGSTETGFVTDDGKVFIALIFVFVYSLWRFAEDYRPIRVVFAGLVALVVLGGAIDSTVVLEALPEEVFAQDGEGDRDSLKSGWGLWLVLGGSALMTLASGLLALREGRYESPAGSGSGETPLPPPE